MEPPTKTTPAETIRDFRVIRTKTYYLILARIACNYSLWISPKHSIAFVPGFLIVYRFLDTEMILTLDR